MKIGMQTWGTEGDIRPFIALAGELQKAGHEVILAATCFNKMDFASFEKNLGFRLIDRAMPEYESNFMARLGKTLVDERNFLKRREMLQPLSKRYVAVFFLLGIAVVCMGSSAVRAESAFAAVQSKNLSEEYPKEISARQAAGKKSKGAFILDVRELNEFLQERIQGAVLIPLGQLRYRLNELPKDKEIVVVCRSSDRSPVGLDILRKAGYKKSSCMTGGINAWKAAGFPTVTGH